MKTYLNYIRLVWKHILSGHTALSLAHGSIVDTVTAKALQTLAPKDSVGDKEAIIQLMANRDIFPSVLDYTVRDVLLKNILLLSSTCLIPTL